MTAEYGRFGGLQALALIPLDNGEMREDRFTTSEYPLTNAQ
jgi:hypothetical protein